MIVPWISPGSTSAPQPAMAVDATTAAHALAVGRPVLFRRIVLPTLPLSNHFHTRLDMLSISADTFRRSSAPVIMDYRANRGSWTDKMTNPHFCFRRACRSPRLSHVVPSELWRVCAALIRTATFLLQAAGRQCRDAPVPCAGTVDQEYTPIQKNEGYHVTLRSSVIQEVA